MTTKKTLHPNPNEDRDTYLVLKLKNGLATRAEADELFEKIGNFFNFLKKGWYS